MATVDEILARQAYADGDETWTKDNNYPSYTLYVEPEYVPVTNKRIADFNDQISVRGEQFQSTPPRGWRQKYYTITTTILHHISTNKSYPTPLKSRPTIPAHSQIRSHCANFPVRIPP